MCFSYKILKWYNLEKRDLPWRLSSDPYKIWISEVILQQTRIAQGTAYYLRFIEKFPNIEELAKAKEDEVLKIWQGLGYYSRARNLHTAAKQIVNDYDGIFPNNALELKTLKGIGDYTASAIASIIFNEPIAVIDGNVYRVLSRIYGIEEAIDSTLGKNVFKNLANQIIEIKNPGDYNQAIMEFGALQCIPKNPNCTNCIFQNECIAFKSNSIHLLPKKEKKTKQSIRFFNYMYIIYKEGIYFKKRVENDIWKNMYDLPLIETSTSTTIEELSKATQWISMFRSTKTQIQAISKEHIHKLSHQSINVKFIELSINSEKNLPSNFIRIDKRNIFDLAVPKVIEKFLSTKNL
ncbi:MAG: A/G-specific adenine glycosylase [Prolixibacteraceae bacterium]|nr:A/G-specific adenine glycosylase [Prolixibacteraceae bacterium]